MQENKTNLNRFLSILSYSCSIYGIFFENNLPGYYLIKISLIFMVSDFYCKYQNIKFLKAMNSFRRYFRVIMLALLLLSFPVISVLGQQVREEAPPLRDRLFFGGNFGLLLGTYTDIQVSPVIGLWLLPRLAVAVGPEYRYYREPGYSTTIYGGKAYLQFSVVKDMGQVIQSLSNTGIFLHLEDELLNIDSGLNNPQLTGRYNLNTLLGGVGISQQIGRRASLQIMALWTLNDTNDRLYSNPEIRVNFTF
jgi:hypothetical protein